MNLKTLTLSAAIALGLLAAPVAQAQRAEGRAARGPATRTQPAISGDARTQLEHRRHGDWNRHRYYPRYHRRYSPFYGYPFSHGYPYGYPGYGYPYFGASAALYYYGYHPQPRPQAQARVYTPRGGDSVVAQVQRELARNGYYRGVVDGVMGNGTRNAIRSYERANGLRVDGRIDGELLRSIGIE